MRWLLLLLTMPCGERGETLQRKRLRLKRAPILPAQGAAAQPLPGTAVGSKNDRVRFGRHRGVVRTWEGEGKSDKRQR